MFVTLRNFIHNVKHLSLKVETVHFFVCRVKPFLLPLGIREAPNVLHTLRDNHVVEKRLNFVDVSHYCVPSNMLQTPTMTSKIKLVVIGGVLVLNFSETVLVGERDYSSLVLLRLLLATALDFDLGAGHKTRGTIPAISCSGLPLQS